MREFVSQNQHELGIGDIESKTNWQRDDRPKNTIRNGR